VAGLAALALTSALAFGQERTDTPDPIEGKWLGMTGFPQDRVELGLEIKRNAQHELKVYLHQPVINFYGYELPGVMKNEGDTYVLAEYAIAFTLQGDKLEGTYMGLNAPATLARTDKLPMEVAVPDLPKGPGPKWTAKLGGAIYAPAAARDGIAYVGTTGGVFYAIKIADGSVAWHFDSGRPMYGEALATEDAVYFVCDSGYLYKLDRQTGKEAWRYDLGDERATRFQLHPLFTDGPVNDFDLDIRGPRPLLVDGLVYVGSGDGGFHAIDAANGERIWRFETKGKIRTCAARHGELVYVGSFDHHVYALDRSTGEEVWNKDTQATVSSSPVFVGDKLIVGNRGGLLAAIEPTKGAVQWRMGFWGSSVESDAVPYGDLFYIGSSDLRRVTCIDPKDARVVWRTDVYGCPWGRVAVTESAVFVSAVGYQPYTMRHFGSFTALDRKSGKIAWRWPMPEWPGSLGNGFAAGPVVANDLVIVGGLNGSLYAFPAV
jgi:outer membrane protein assembly factor BamB